MLSFRGKNKKIKKKMRKRRKIGAWFFSDIYLADSVMHLPRLEKQNKTNRQVIRRTKNYCRFQKAVELKGWSPLSSHCPLQPACTVSARKLFKVPVA